MLSISLISLIKCRLREFRREPSALIFVLLMPILWMLFLSLTEDRTLTPQKIRVGVSSNDIQLIHLLNTATQKKDLSLHPIIIPTDPKDLSNVLKVNQIDLYLTFDNSKSIVYHFDPYQPSKLLARQTINSLIQEHLGRQDTILSSDAPLMDSVSYIHFIIPGLLALSLFTTSLFGTGMTIVANRREQLLKLYRSTPMPLYEYILSHIVGRFFIVLIESITILTFGYLFFNFTIQGHYLTFFLFVFLSAAAFTSLSMLCGSRTKLAASYHGTVNLLILPMMIASGIFFDRQRLPDWLQDYLVYLPLSASVDAIRGVSLYSLSFTELLPQFFTLVSFLLLTSLITLRIFRWD